MKTESICCDICGKKPEPNFEKCSFEEFKELELPIYAIKDIEYDKVPKYEKRKVCKNCSRKIAEKIFTLQIEKHIKEEAEE